MNRLKNSNINYLVLITILMVGAYLWSQNIFNEKITVLKDPKPTCEEKGYKELVQVGELKESIDDDFFLVAPLNLTVDDDGNIYIFDRKQMKIAKYNRNLKFIKEVGHKGSGPSDFGASRLGMEQIYPIVGDDKLLYVGDRSNRTIHIFDLNLNFIKDIRIRMNTQPSIIPVMDSKKNFYIHSFDFTGGNLINIFDFKGEKLFSLLDSKELRSSLFSKFEKYDKNFYYQGTESSLKFYIQTNDRLAVVNLISGYFYLFKDFKMIKKRALWPKMALEMSKIRDDGSGIFLFSDLIPDQDDRKYFYLNFGLTPDEKRFLLYKFDEDGNFNSVLSIKRKDKNYYVRINCKKNKLFYGIGKNDDSEQTLVVYREDKK